MNTGMISMLVLLLSESLVVQCRHVPSAKSSISLVDSNHDQQQVGRPTAAEVDDLYSDEDRAHFDSQELFDGLTLVTDGDKNYAKKATLEERQRQRVFNDFGPYMGKFIYRLIVRRALIRPMINGMKRLVPGSMYQYYNKVMLSNRVFQMMEPLSPAISSYTYTKFEQGIFWSLKRAGTFFMDNFIELER